MRVQFAYRGDGRDEAAMRLSGGFVPKYLLETHVGGLAGFIACNNKTDGKLGCNCPQHTEFDLFTRARQKLTLMLQTPMVFQQHVMFNNVGLLSTATAPDDAYGGHQYKIVAEWEMDAQLETAANDMGLAIGRLNMISRNFRFVSNAKRINKATLFGVVPHQGVEVSFVSPVEYRYMRYGGHI
jgi:hypothetical protein